MIQHLTKDANENAGYGAHMEGGFETNIVNVNVIVVVVVFVVGGSKLLRVGTTIVRVGYPKMSKSSFASIHASRPNVPYLDVVPTPSPDKLALPLSSIPLPDYH